MTSICVQPVRWDLIHDETFVFEDQCWSTCNGGFCCNHKHPDFHFQLLPTHGATIIYLEDEYRWLTTHGKAPTRDNLGVEPNVFAFDFGGPRPLSLVQMTCRLLGKCQGVIDKPLLC